MRRSALSPSRPLDPKIVRLLAKFVAGRLDDRQSAAVGRLLRRSAEARRTVQLLRRQRLPMGRPVPGGKSRRSRSRWGLIAAGVLCLGLITGAGVGLLVADGGLPEVVVSQESDVPVPVATPKRAFVAPAPPAMKPMAATSAPEARAEPSVPEPASAKSPSSAPEAVTAATPMTNSAAAPLVSGAEPMTLPDVSAEPVPNVETPRVEAAEPVAAKPPAPSSRPLPPETGRGVSPPAGKLSAQELSRFIDGAIQAKLDAAGVKTSPVADDTEFLRRVYLDLNGTIPTAAKVVAFLDSKDPDKRAKLIDELLASPLYGEHMMDTWMKRVRGKTGGRERGSLPTASLKAWLVGQFNANRPWNEQVYDMLISAGPTDPGKGGDVAPTGAPSAWLTPGDGKIGRDLTERANLVARVFLGRGEIKCAQCHNHPFTSFRKKSYWAFTRLFTQVKAKFPGVLYDDLAPTAVKDVDEGLLLPPAFFDGEVPNLEAGANYRKVLADWVTSPRNRYFSRAKINWMWAYFFGRGFTDTYDEMSDEAVVSHPELLQALADQFVANGFDVHYLIRAICNSAAYQRSSKPANGNDEDHKLFSHRNIQMLTPSQLVNALGTLNGTGVSEKGRRSVFRVVGEFAAITSVDGELPDYTLYERNLADQAMYLDAMTPAWARLVVTRVVQARQTPAQNVASLYYTVLSRPPAAEELTDMVGHVQKVGAREGYIDVAWVLLNSTEFATNH